MTFEHSTLRTKREEDIALFRRSNSRYLFYRDVIRGLSLVPAPTTICGFLSRTFLAEDTNRGASFLVGDNEPVEAFFCITFVSHCWEKHLLSSWHTRRLPYSCANLELLCLLWNFEKLTILHKWRDQKFNVSLRLSSRRPFWKDKLVRVFTQCKLCASNGLFVWNILMQEQYRSSGSRKNNVHPIWCTDIRPWQCIL